MYQNFCLTFYSLGIESALQSTNKIAKNEVSLHIFQGSQQIKANSNSCSLIDDI
jgi:hypothetical protein